MPSKEFLLEQIARAKRFATAVTSKADQEKFEKIAADYQSQLDAAESTASTPATETVSSEAPASINESLVDMGRPFTQLTASLVAPPKFRSIVSGVLTAPFPDVYDRRV
jgi:hypothetical protein